MTDISLYLRSIEKANCHLHITGSLTPGDLRYLSKITKIDISESEPLESHINFFDPVIWSVAKNITSTYVGFLEAIKIILEREQKDGVIYAEITVNPYGMIQRGMTPVYISEAIQEGVKFGNSIGIKPKFKFGVNRKDGPGSVPIVKEVFLTTPKDSRICVDLNGDERTFKTLDFINAFSKLKSAKIPISLHAGEYANNNESLEKIISIVPDRIVHGIAFVTEESLIELLLEKGIVLEMSPLSNIKTGSVKNNNNHPIKKFIDWGVPIILGSDDPAFFLTTVSSEFQYLAEIGVDINNINEINKRGLHLRR